MKSKTSITGIPLLLVLPEAELEVTVSVCLMQERHQHFKASHEQIKKKHEAAWWDNVYMCECVTFTHRAKTATEGGTSWHFKIPGVLKWWCHPCISAYKNPFRDIFKFPQKKALP